MGRKGEGKSKGAAITLSPISNKKQPESLEPAQQVIYRYSDQDLAEFKELICIRLETAKKEFQFLNDQLKGKDEMDGEATRLDNEDGSISLEIEHCGQLAARQMQYIKNLEYALIRINNKTYGICRITGKLIDKARLRVVPHATLSMEAKSK
ncbi:MAG: TraR/DksA family transcriptional regulator [Flavipsychrobacter sp.]|jgi:RNA polymerase-binding transcription factor DksA|nr:TraR/DksA family transcriptional regulator [Flavipsychrobacter sp.]